MAVTAKLYGRTFITLANKEWDWDSDDIRVALLTDAYVPDQDAHDYLNDVGLGANEIAVTGDYTAGGVALAGKTSTYDGATNKHKLDADNWVVGVPPNPVTATFRYAVIYSRTPGTDATRPLIAYVDFGANQTINGGKITIEWAAAGIAEVTVS